MSMRLTRHLGIAAVLTGWVAPNLASAEIKLTDFNGMWSGRGKDRNSPLESLQQTSCQTRVQADLRRLSSNTVCNGEDGLHKEIKLSITLDGNRITGELTQNTAVRGAPEPVRNGTVLGSWTEDMASYEVQFPGVWPNPKVELKLLNPSSYSMHVTYLGTMMDVVFHRPARR